MNIKKAELPTTKRRLKYVDMAKIIASMCIIVGHTSGSDCVLFFDNMRVPLFWLMAGFTSHATFSLRHKAKVLLRPYLVMSIICLLFTAVYEPSRLSWESIAGILYSRYRLEAIESAGYIRLMPLYNSVLWFLTSLFTAYCIFKVIMMPRRILHQLLLSVASFGVCFLFLCLPILLPWSIDTAFFIAPILWTGHQIRRFKLHERRSVLVFMICVAGYTVCNHLAGFTNYSLRELGAHFPAVLGCSVFGPLAFLILCRWLERSRFASFMAEINTMALYIFGLQLIFLAVSGRLMNHFAMPQWLTVSVQLVTAVAGGYYAGKLIKYCQRGLVKQR